MIKRYKLFFLFFFFPIILLSQAGRGVYRFLDLPMSSHLAALGGGNVSLSDNDLNFAFSNPALLTKQADGVVGLNYASYLADVKFGSAIYGKTIKEKNYFALGIQFLDYGRFLGKTETGENPSGGEQEEYFRANDLGIYLAYARPIDDKINLGCTFKPVFSVYERYVSVGLAFDLAASYVNKDHLFSVGLVLRNIGMQLKGYYSDEEGQHREKLPFDIRLGATKRFVHAPIRFSFTLHNLQTWNLAYQSTNQKTTTLLSEKVLSEPGFLEKAFRHAIIGVEFLPTESFYLAFGYDHRRRQELSVDGFKSFSGFSFGAGIKIYKFQVGFSMMQFQRGVNSVQLSISSSLNEFNF